MVCREDAHRPRAISIPWMSLALLAKCRILPVRLEVFGALAVTAVQSGVEFGFLFTPLLDAGTIKLIAGSRGGEHPLGWVRGSCPVSEINYFAGSVLCKLQAETR